MKSFLPSFMQSFPRACCWISGSSVDSLNSISQECLRSSSLLSNTPLPLATSPTCMVPLPSYISGLPYGCQVWPLCSTLTPWNCILNTSILIFSKVNEFSTAFSHIKQEMTNHPMFPTSPFSSPHPLSCLALLMLSHKYSLCVVLFCSDTGR